MVDFFAPASMMWTFLSQIGHRNEKVGDLGLGPSVEAAPRGIEEGSLDGGGACPCASAPPPRG
jgi:hypothetical protein